MVDFGFGLVPSSRINLDLFDKARYEELASVEPDVRKCMSCGSCTAVCTPGETSAHRRPVSKYSATSLREAIECIHNGQPDKALGMLKSCQFCGKCTMVCPRGINTRHLILSINKIYGKL